MFTELPLEIQQNVQKVLDAALELDYIESADVVEPPSYLLTQVSPGEYVYIHYVVKGNRSPTGETVDVCFLVPTSIIDEDSYKHLPFEHLFDCPCPVMESSEMGQSLIAGHEPFRNRGKLVYFVRPPNMDFVILEQEPPELVIIKSEALQSLEQKLLALDKVNSVQIEYIKDPKIIAAMDCERPLNVVANIDVIDKFNPHVKTYNACFTMPETVYEIEANHQWAIDNLQEVITKSNVE